LFTNTALASAPDLRGNKCGFSQVPLKRMNSFAEYVLVPHGFPLLPPLRVYSLNLDEEQTYRSMRIEVFEVVPSERKYLA
jgi:hypothetical protein